MNRRFVFGVIAALLAVMVLGGIVVWVAGGDGSPRTAALLESRSSSEFSWQLYRAGTFWADLESVAGCDVRGEVVTGQDPATGDAGKHIAGVVASPCRLEVAVNSRVSSALYTWINAALSETHTRRNLTLLKRATDTSGQDLGISLENALIEQVELPVFNAADTSAAPATVTLTIRPERTTRESSPALPNPPSASGGSATTRSFGVDVGTGALGVSRFEPWSAAVAITRNAATSDPDAPVYVPGATSLGDLGLSIPVASGTGSELSNLHNWFEELVLENEGFPDPSQERTLTFTMRNPQTGAALLTVTFTNVGIFAQPSYALGSNPERFLFYAEGASFAGSSAAP